MTPNGFCLKSNAVRKPPEFFFSLSIISLEFPTRHLTPIARSIEGKLRGRLYNYERNFEEKSFGI